MHSLMISAPSPFLVHAAPAMHHSAQRELNTHDEEVVSSFHAFSSLSDTEMWKKNESFIAIMSSFSQYEL